jgi:hypothetical protein
MINQPLFFVCGPTGTLISVLLLAIAQPSHAQDHSVAADLTPSFPSRSSDSVPLTVWSDANPLFSIAPQQARADDTSETLHTFDSSVTLGPPEQPFSVAQIDPLPNIAPNIPDSSPGNAPGVGRDATPSTPDGSAGQAPTLQTEPSQPGQPPFKPNRIQLKKASRFVGRPSPAVTIVTPSAYGQASRTLGVGISFQERTRFSQKSDGSFGFGLGFGDPRKVGALSLGLISNSSFRSGFFERGTLNIKAYRYLPYNVAIAAGVNNGIRWGQTDASVSPYGVVTKQFILRPQVSVPFSRLYVSAGLGGGQFRSEDDVARGTETVGAFGSVALRVAEPITLISEWSGQDLTLGLSVAPLRKFPLVFTPAVTDITRNAGNGPRFIFGIGYGFKF